MTRAERICRRLPTWMLLMILEYPAGHRLQGAAFLEVWKREIEDEIAFIANEASGPWPVAMPRGLH